MPHGVLGFWGAHIHHFTDVTHLPPSAREAQGSGKLVSPMDGVVVQVAAQVGQRAQRGETLVVLEAMKLQHRVVADVDGEVAQVHVREGMQVARGKLLVELTADED